MMRMHRFALLSAVALGAAACTAKEETAPSAAPPAGKGSAPSPAGGSPAPAPGPDRGRDPGPTAKPEEAMPTIVPDGAETKTTPSGLKYSVLKEGGPGPTVKEGDRIRVRYTGWLQDGKLFDSSNLRPGGAPAEFTAGALIEGCNEALRMMTAGARWKITIPPNLGYGDAGAPPRIPGGATLVFDMELVSIRSFSIAFEFRPPDKAAQKVTASGLRYEILKEGTGPAPGPEDVVELEYGLYLESGEVLDSSAMADRRIQGTKEQMALGVLKEGPFLMKEGEECLFEVPPALGFGEKPRGKIPANGTTIWWIRLSRTWKKRPVPVFEMPASEKIRRTPSGLGISTVVEGKGDPPGPADRVVVHYAGWLTDGTLFDSSYPSGLPATFGLDAVIPGWTEGLQAMRPGGIALLVVPPDLGYGKMARPKIPADSTLVFRVELLEVAR